MDKLTTLKGALCSFVGMTGSLFIKLLGGWDEILDALIVLMALDFFSGLIAAYVFKTSTKTMNGRLESRALLKGLVRKGLSFSIVIVGSVLDGLAGTDIVRNAVIIGLCVGETLSFVENLGLMGVKMPDAIMQGLEIFQRNRK